MIAVLLQPERYRNLRDRVASRVPLRLMGSRIRFPLRTAPGSTGCKAEDLPPMIPVRKIGEKRKGPACWLPPFELCVRADSQ